MLKYKNLNFKKLGSVEYIELFMKYINLLGFFYKNLINII